jgi:hypothetical protein
MLAQGAQQKKSAVRLYDVADHLHPAVLSGGGESVYCTLETIEGVRIAPGHTDLEGLVVPYTGNKRADTHGHAS